MIYEYRKLRGRIREKYNTESAFAKVVEITPTQMSAKLNCKAGFDQKDIELWCDKLDIPIIEAGVYFFT